MIRCNGKEVHKPAGVILQRSIEQQQPANTKVIPGTITTRKPISTGSWSGNPMTIVATRKQTMDPAEYSAAFGKLISSTSPCDSFMAVCVTAKHGGNDVQRIGRTSMPRLNQNGTADRKSVTLSG